MTSGPQLILLDHIPGHQGRGPGLVPGVWSQLSSFSQGVIAGVYETSLGDGKSPDSIFGEILACGKGSSHAWEPSSLRMEIQPNP